MPKRLLLADLDRTLFDTACFFEAVWRLAEGMYGIDADKEMINAPNFYDLYDSGYDYRFFDHMAAVCDKSYDQQEFEQVARERYSDRFVYADVSSQVLAMIDGIVTFGGDAYQSFKLSLCPRLLDLPVHITLRPKGEYIQTTFTTPVTLIDDKVPIPPLELPHRLILINRTVAPTLTSPGVIASLDTLPEMLASFD